MQNQKKSKRRAQISMEFMLFCAIGLLLMITFLSLVNSWQSNLNDRKEILLVKDLAYSIQSEIYLASVVEDGYSRTFTIPKKLEGINYSVYIYNETLKIYLENSERFEMQIKFPEVTGILWSEGETSRVFTIRKENGEIYLNA
jgi:uncharacterized protein (UPF0333 family)